MRTGHRKVVTEDHPVEAQLAAQDVLQPAAREPGRLVVDLRVDHMRRHHRCQLPAKAGERHQVRLAQLFEAALVGRNRYMRIRLGPAMPWEMLAASCHARRIHAANECASQLCGTLRVAFEGTAANHRAALVVEVEHRSEAEVQADREHLGGHQPAALLGQVLGIGIVGDGAHRRQAYEALAQALHAAAFLVDRKDQVGTDGANRCAQLTHLAWAVDVAGEDDQAGHFRLA